MRADISYRYRYRGEEQTKNIMRYRNKKTEEKTNPPDNERGWVSLAEAARAVPYSAEYLGLLARRKILPAKKIRGVWYTTLPVVEGYMREQMERSLGNTGVMPPPLVSLAAETFSKKVFFRIQYHQKSFYPEALLQQIFYIVRGREGL